MLAPVTPALRPVRIMELGDSITAGIMAGGGPDPHAGYRSSLAQLLASHRYHFAMVGSRTDYSGQLAYPQHEGWPGYVLRSYPSRPAGQLYGPIIHDAIVSYHPDIILLMAGTNDLLRYEDDDAGYTLPNVKHSMDLVLNQIFTLDPHATVIVAGVVNSPKVDEHAVFSFDNDPRDGIIALVSKYRSFGRSIYLAAGMDRAVPRSSVYFPDGIHPSGGDGYDRIAAVWYRALQLVLTPESGAVASSGEPAKP
jgi:lysophospholipase L1-like esterase